MNEQLREETELRLLMTATLTENQEVREKILDFPRFMSSAAKRIQDAFIEVYIKNPAADYSLFWGKLERNELLVFVNLRDSIISITVEEENVNGVLEFLRETWEEQQLRQELYKLINSGELTSDALREIAENAERGNPESANSAEKYISDYETPVEVIPTGFVNLDSMLGDGVARGTVSAIGARPSVGKTTFAVNIAVHNPQRKIIIFSLEMSSRMVYDKLIADVADVRYLHAVKHKVAIDIVSECLIKYHNLLVIDDVYQIEEIAAVIRREKPELVIIDYIQIVQSKQEFDTQRQRIDYIVQLIKRTAKQTRAHIMCLSQINRTAKEDPTMSALKESGGLEEAGDYVLILKRPYVLNKSDERFKPEDTELIVDKNKFGQSGILKFNFDGNHQRFTEI